MDGEPHILSGIFSTNENRHGCAERSVSRDENLLRFAVIYLQECFVDVIDHLQDDIEALDVVEPLKNDPQVVLEVLGAAELGAAQGDDEARGDGVGVGVFRGSASAPRIPRHTRRTPPCASILPRVHLCPQVHFVACFHERSVSRVESIHQHCHRLLHREVIKLLVLALLINPVFYLLPFHPLHRILAHCFQHIFHPLPGHLGLISSLNIR